MAVGLLLNCNTDSPSCPANAIQIGGATLAIWAAIKINTAYVMHATTPNYIQNQHNGISVSIYTQ